MKIEPENQFVASSEALGVLLAHYDLVCLDYSEASSGIENKTLIVTTDRGKFVVRVYRRGKKHLADINVEIDFVKFLHGNGVSVPEILQNNSNNYVTTMELDGTIWQAIVMDFIEGTHAKNYTPQLVEELAATQAQLHKLASSYDTANGLHANELSELRESFFIKQIDRTYITNRLVDGFLERAQNYVVAFDQSLPKGLCHLDYDKDNALTKDNALAAILDFDDLAIAPFVVCLSYTLWHVRQYAGKDAVAHYLSAYESIRPLLELEKTYIQPVMLFRHYVISSIKILNNHLTIREVNSYLSLESELSS